MNNNTLKKKRLIYSICLKKTDNPIIQEFIENQTNLSETMRYLMYKHISENSTEDISYKLSSLMYENAITTNSDNTKFDNKSICETVQDNIQNNLDDEIEEEQLKEIYDNEKSDEELDIDIPSCYQ